MRRLCLLVALAACLCPPPAAGQYTGGMGEPEQPWQLDCGTGQAVAGIFTRLHLTADGATDWHVAYLCWEIDNHAFVKVNDSACVMKEPFELTGHVLVGDESVNCAPGEFVNGIHAEFVDGKRMAQLRCCLPENAEVDHTMGCHTTTPVDIGALAQSGVETPYEHQLDCPNWVAVGWESCSSGVKIKYCPFRINSAGYNSKKCRQVRTTDVESCPTTFYQSWSVQCTPTQTIAGFSTVMLDGGEAGASDWSFNFFCRDVDASGAMEVAESDCYWTEPDAYTLATKLDWEAAVNCKPGEYISAVRSAWNETRTMWFKCCKPTNGRIARSVGCHSTVGTPTFVSPYSGAKSPYEPDLGCPRYALTAMYSCGDNLLLGYCPFEVDGVEYVAGCRDRRTTDWEESPACVDSAGAGGEPATGGTPCIQRVCDWAGYCPVNCDHNCEVFHELMHEERRWERLLGWECRALQEHDCCCFFESSDPDCSAELNEE